MSPDNPQTSLYPFYLKLFPHQHFFKYAFPHAMSLPTIFFFFLALQRSHETVSIREALSQSLALMLTYCLAQGKLFNLAETQLSICKMGVIISTMWILSCGLGKIITIKLSKVPGR